MTPERRYCGSCGTYHERYAQATRDEDDLTGRIRGEAA
jgi:hypothetical protein